MKLILPDLESKNYQALVIFEKCWQNIPEIPTLKIFVDFTFFSVSVFQYFINKAHYWEKKFTIQENVKANKKLKNQNVDEQIAEFLGPPPTIYDTLPFQTYRGIKYLIFTIPTLPGTILSSYKEMKEKKAEEERLIREEEEMAKQREIEKLEKKQRKRERKRIVYDEKEKGKCKNPIYLLIFFS